MTTCTRTKFVNKNQIALGWYYRANGYLYLSIAILLAVCYTIATIIPHQSSLIIITIRLLLFFLTLLSFVMGLIRVWVGKWNINHAHYELCVPDFPEELSSQQNT